jgi:hypothetical protein
MVVLVVCRERFVGEADNIIVLILSTRCDTPVRSFSPCHYYFIAHRLKKFAKKQILKKESLK